MCKCESLVLCLFRADNTKPQNRTNRVRQCRLAPPSSALTVLTRKSYSIKPDRRIYDKEISTHTIGPAADRHYAGGATAHATSRPPGRAHTKSFARKNQYANSTQHPQTYPKNSPEHFPKSPSNLPNISHIKRSKILFVELYAKQIIVVNKTTCSRINSD